MKDVSKTYRRGITSHAAFGMETTLLHLNARGMRPTNKLVMTIFVKGPLTVFTGFCEMAEIIPSRPANMYG